MHTSPMDQKAGSHNDNAKETGHRGHSTLWLEYGMDCWQMDCAQLAGMSAELFWQKLEQPEPFCLPTTDSDSYI